MYLKRLHLKNFRSLKEFDWSLADGEEAGWHVLLGPNGCGKSSVLKAIALAIGGNSAFFALRLPADQFLRQGSSSTSIDMDISWASRWDSWEGGGYKAKRSLIPVALTLTKKNTSAGFTSDGKIPDLTLWSGRRGWFSAAFGPMRRFSGDGKPAQQLSQSSPRLARHLSIFGEEFALGESLVWLKELHHKGLEEQHAKKLASKKPNDCDLQFKAGLAGHASTKLLSTIKRLLNESDLLPHDVKFDSITSEKVLFVDGNGAKLSILDLSDGYRAVLAMVLELLRLMLACYGDRDLISADGTHALAPGIVLIDEVDAHLHPEWQRTIGQSLCRIFPKVQFIVTTHSTHVAQGASNGSIWVMPEPGGDGTAKRLTGEPLARVIYGDVLHALGGEAFGGVPGRSDQANDKLDRMAALGQREVLKKLTTAQKRELRNLQAALSAVMLPGQ